jgi:hypothetical protein
MRAGRQNPFVLESTTMKNSCKRHYLEFDSHNKYMTSYSDKGSGTDVKSTDGSLLQSPLRTFAVDCSGQNTTNKIYQASFGLVRTHTRVANQQLPRNKATVL